MAGPVPGVWFLRSEACLPVHHMRCQDGKLDHFHLVELMLPDKPPSILSVGPCLGPEARSERSIINGQILLVQNLIGMDVGDRHFRRGNEKIFPPFSLNRSSSNLGSWPVPVMVLRLTIKGGQHFFISMLCGVGGQHKIDKGSFHQGAVPQVQGKAGPGNAGGPFKIQDCQDPRQWSNERQVHN